MEFDPDRLAKLAGISGTEPASKPAVKQAPASSGLIRESAALRKHSSESKEVKQLRQLIRTEASQVIREMKAERLALAEGDLTRLQTRRSLSEAVAMGFYGPGFAGSRASTLGGPMTSSGRLFVNENQIIDPALENEAIEFLKKQGLDASTIAAVQKELEQLNPNEIDPEYIDAAREAVKKVKVVPEMQNEADDAGKPGFLQRHKVKLGSVGAIAGGIGGLLAMIMAGINNPSTPAEWAALIGATGLAFAGRVGLSVGDKNY